MLLRNLNVNRNLKVKQTNKQTQFWTVWGYSSRSDGYICLANQVRSYLPIKPYEYPKIAYRLEASPGSGFIQTRSVTCQPLGTFSPHRCCLSWRHYRVMRITWSPLWRSSHSFTEFRNLYFPQKNAIFIATARVVKDAADATDYEVLGNNGTICVVTICASYRWLAYTACTIQGHPNNLLQLNTLYT